MIFGGRRMRRSLGALVCCLAAAAQSRVTVEVERFDGSRLAIQNFAEHRATVLLFLSTRCPATDTARTTIAALGRKYRRAKILFAGVFPNPAEPGDEVRLFCQASGFVFPCYRDPQHSAAVQLGATVTPQAFVLGAAGEKLYAGGVDGLEQALEALAGGKSVAVAESKAEGTSIDHPAPPRQWTDPYSSISFSSELIFEKIPDAAAHHASSITEAANGDLLVTWYGGSYESSDDEALYMARRPKGKREWEAPRMLLRNPAQPMGNAVVFTTSDGTVWIIWGRMEATQPLLPHTGWERTRLMMRVSRDNGVTWSNDTPFPMDTTGWLPRNVAVRLADGGTMVPVSDERNDRDLSFFLITHDNGKTWTRSRNIPNAQSQGEQPAVAQRKDGSFLAYLRTAPRLLKSESKDGMEWSAAAATELKNPDAAISLCALRNGNLLLVWNDTERARTPLHIARSTDGGTAWQNKLVLESNPGEYSYPSVIQTSDGRIHVIYTYRRYAIKHVEFNEDWLLHTERPN